MQTYDEDIDVIPNYINKLEDTQKQTNQAGNPITDHTLFLFVANAMLRTYRFPRANEKWEELASSNRNWTKWKTIYRKADMTEKVKKTALGRKD